MEQCLQHHTVMRTVLALTLMASLVLTQEGSGNGLPAGHEEILSRWTVTTTILCILLTLSSTSPYNPDSFSCDDQAYGYYADVESGCEVTGGVFCVIISFSP